MLASSFSCSARGALPRTKPDTELELGDAGRQVEFVVGHQDGFWRYTEKTGQCRDGLAAAVHVRGGYQQTNVFALIAELGCQAEILAVSGQVDALGAGDAFYEKSPCVMPGLFVFGAGVSQADDQLNGGHVRGSSLELWATRYGCVARATPAC